MPILPRGSGKIDFSIFPLFPAHLYMRGMENAGKTGMGTRKGPGRFSRKVREGDANLFRVSRKRGFREFAVNDARGDRPQPYTCVSWQNFQRRKQKFPTLETEISYVGFRLFLRRVCRREPPFPHPGVRGVRTPTGKGLIFLGA